MSWRQFESDRFRLSAGPESVGASRVDLLKNSIASVVVARPYTGGITVVKLTLREKESIQDAVRRFRKLVERSGIKKEMRRREFYEKPSEIKRRARLRAERRAFRASKMAAR